jgi:hypothetical protein
MPTPRRMFIGLQALKKLRCGSQWMRLVVSYGKASVALDSNYYACPKEATPRGGFLQFSDIYLEVNLIRFWDS